MKIAVLGTKGIPNNYGGFEQFAEYLSKGLVQRGHDVTVYNPHFHEYKESCFEGVKIKRVYSPEKYLGSSANFLYDYLCLKDALTHEYDIIYEAGYHSVALAYVLLGIKSRRSPVIITNMDGLEWMRSKWNYITKKVIKSLEKIAVNHSHFLISDNVGIRQYYENTFNKESFFLPYGADIIEDFNQEHLQAYSLSPLKYYLLIARLEPENNVEMILDGYLQSSKEYPVCIIGNAKSRYGEYLTKKYNHPNIRFLGAIYKKPALDSLRHFSNIYFHGHSVGGTNPSLLEAMACQSFILAHDNPFNKSVLEENALYFETSENIKAILRLQEPLRRNHSERFAQANKTKIKNIYNWEFVVAQHEALFKKLVK
jgi:glycosyltransferase involved in cell wall biosynthesis